MEEDETQQRLKNLQAMIRNVYLPLMESKVETKLHMEKFQKQINISLQQAYGNVTIRVPPVPANKDDDEIRKDRRTIEEFQTAIVSQPTFMSCVGRVGADDQGDDRQGEGPSQGDQHCLRRSRVLARPLSHLQHPVPAADHAPSQAHPQRNQPIPLFL